MVVKFRHTDVYVYSSLRTDLPLHLQRRELRAYPELRRKCGACAIVKHGCHADDIIHSCKRLLELPGEFLVGLYQFYDQMLF